MSERTSVRIPERITLTTPHRTGQCTPKVHTSVGPHKADQHGTTSPQAPSPGNHGPDFRSHGLGLLVLKST